MGGPYLYASEKKGIGLGAKQPKERILALDVAWYYTWGPRAIEGIPLSKFVPMVWGRHLYPKELNTLQRLGKIPFLLAFNEPDHPDQANMSVDEAIRMWPEISTLSNQISSPAPAQALGPWLEKFVQVAKFKKQNFDFVAVHLYGPPDTKIFLDRVDKIYQKYQLPIWITEFAVADYSAKGKPGKNRFSEASVLSFMKAVLPELEKRKYVMRYAWFGAGKFSASGHEQVRTSRLFESDGSLTALGKFYANFN